MKLNFNFKLKRFCKTSGGGDGIKPVDYSLIPPWYSTIVVAAVYMHYAACSFNFFIHFLFFAIHLMAAIEFYIDITNPH